MKFQDMPYERISYEDAAAQLEALEKRVKEAANAEEALAVLREIDDVSKHLDTTFSLAYIRNTLDTTDAFYEAEWEYIDEITPKLGEWQQRLTIALLQSPHRAALEREIGTLYFQNAEIELRTFSPAIIPDLQEENRLNTEYQKLLASAQIDFDGKTLTLAQLTPYHRDSDRGVRKASLQARADWLMAQSEALDRIFDDMVKVRTRMAQTLGYKSYIELGYDRMTRNCYDAEAVSKFREQIREHIVPLASRIKTSQCSRIGLEAASAERFITLFDEPFVFPDGNPKPIGTPEEIFEQGRKMYHTISPETAEFFDFMLENNLFDVLTRKGKAGGGYCSSLPAYKSPFIFANFNGTSDDIDVLTHEAGHAFADYQNRDVFPLNLQSPTYEACEVHSMSMEFFAWPYMESFFGAQADKYRYAHLSSALTFLPYGAMVDHFQHIVYERPGMTPRERNEAWLELEAQYRPWLDNDFTFYGEGRRWQAQSHIYERPFYYIDYCLAQTVALAFWALCRTDDKEAWSRYMRYTSKGGTATFTRLIELAGMASPFGPEALKQVSQTAALWLTQNQPSK